MRLATLTMVSALAACGGGGGGGGGGATGSGSTSTGVLLDAEVAGVQYVAEPSGLNGVTNAAGEYNYKAGDNITFSVGGIVLGTAPGTGVITPTSLAQAASISKPGVVESDIAINIAVFLQSFDSDGNPDNGITIDESVGTAAADLVLDFEQTTGDFSVDPTLGSLAGSEGATLVSATDARDHSDASLARFLGGSWQLVDDPGSSLAILTFLSDGTYVLGIDHVDPDCSDGIEYGSYAIDSIAMTLQSTGVSLDSTGFAGACGLYEDGSGELISIDVISDNQFAFNVGDEVINLVRVQNQGIEGSWTEWSSASPGNPKAILTFLSDGQYMVAQLEEEPGVETGDYSVNNNQVSATPEVDTNGGTGLSTAPSDLTIAADGYGRLEISSRIDQFEAVFTPNPYDLTLSGNTAEGDITYSECPQVPGYWTYAFGDTTVEWTGSDGWDYPSCTLHAEDTFTVGYDEFLDTPISCGPVCTLDELNTEISGTDPDQREFTSTWSHEPGSNVIQYVKTITSGQESGKSWSETVTLQ